MSKAGGGCHKSTPLSIITSVRGLSAVSDGPEVEESPLDFEAFFYLHYDRIARAIARVTGDPGCAEELAMETFRKFWQTPQAQGDRAAGWLYRTAINLGLYELRRRARHARFQRMLRLGGPATPEEIRSANEDQEQVRRSAGR